MIFFREFRPEVFRSREQYSTAQNAIREHVGVIESAYEFNNPSSDQEAEIVKTLQKFTGFSDYEEVGFAGGLQLTRAGNSFLIALRIHSANTQAYWNSRYGGAWVASTKLTEWEYLGLTQLPEDHGTVLITPETIQQKIRELLHPVDVDFVSHPLFSKRYFVMAADEPQFRRVFSPKVMTAMEKRKGLEVEIQGRDLLVRYRKPITEEIAMDLSAFLSEIHEAGA